MKKRYWILLISLIIIVVTFFTGPTIPKPNLNASLPEIPDDLEKLEEYIGLQEANLPVREDNQARIVWANDTPRVTEYSIIYLHGFAGSYRDGYPVNVNIADSLDANIFLARWAGHGLKPPASLDIFSPENAWASAKEALVIGKKIGKKVIIMSTSTGGTLAVKLAATYPESVYALVNMSPNFEDDQEGAFILNSPWGYELARLISFGENRKIKHKTEMARNYWDTIYPTKALVDLQVLVGETMTPKTFKQVTSPCDYAILL
jgi:pimeloyl-ACP methyl ester carboxylesterase